MFHGVYKHTAVKIDYMRVEIVEGLPVVKSRMFDTHTQNSQHRVLDSRGGC
jgi:hypothetical protein